MVTIESKLLKTPSTLPPGQFVGLTIALDVDYQHVIQEIVAKLGVQQLLIRIPSWDMENLAHYVRFMELFPQQEFVINLIQSRDSFKDLCA